MTYALFFISIILLLISIFQLFINGDPLTYFICFCITIVFTGIFYDVEEKFSNVKIDLPEEYNLISNDKSKPDTLIGYYRNDSLIIEFK